MGPIIASMQPMAITKRKLILSLVAATVGGLLMRASMTDSQSASASELKISPKSCSAEVDGWLEQADWPTDEVLLGDHVYTRSQLFNLSHSEGNPVADLGLSLATAQLNLAAGAEPGAELVDALFEADLWLLDNHEADRRSQEDRTDLVRLSSVLNQFNRSAAESPDCGYSI
jgi:hypothetical protein